MIYDHDKLLDEIGNIKHDIKQLEDLLVQRREKLSEYQGHLAASGAILEMHKNGSQD